MDYFWGAFRVASHPYTWVTLTLTFVMLTGLNTAHRDYWLAVGTAVCGFISIYFLLAAIDYRKNPG